MPKNKISEYSTTNSDNSDIEGINISEGCAPSGINNAIRELMVHLKEFQTGASGDPLTVAGAFVASAGVTANTLTLTGILTASGGTIMSGTNTMSGGNILSGTNTISGAAIISGNINSSGTTNTFSGGNIFSGTNTISGSAIISGNINSSGTNTFSGSSVMSFSGGTSASPSIYFASDTNTGVFSPAADTVAISTGGSERVRVDSSGNVGIGTSSPNIYSGGTYKRITVSDSASNGYGVITAAGGSGGGGEIDFGNQTIRQAAIATVDGSILGFYTNATNSGSSVSERARITSGGDFLVGTTTSGAGLGFNCVLTVSSTATNPAVFKWDGGGTAAYPVRTWNTATTSNNLFVQFSTEAANTERGSIDYNRANSLVRYNTTSDATLKNIIGDSDGKKSVEILNSTRIREFVWKDDAQQKPQIGVIAQELYETYKGAVSVGGEVENTNEQGNVTTEYRPWGVDKTAFTFHLIAGWQAHEKLLKEAMTRIEALEAEVAAMKAGNGN